MQDLLSHPAVQGGIAPFLVALVAAIALRRWRLSGLALAAGFITTVLLTSSFGLTPLTATRKAILLVVLAAALGTVLARSGWRWMRVSLATAAGIAILWVTWRILQQHQFVTALPWGAGCAAYAAWLVFWSDRLHGQPARAGSAGLALGLGTGLAALLGSSTLLGMLGLSLGAASGAYLLVPMLTGRQLPCSRAFTLPLSLASAVIGCLGVLTASLPWYALLVLAAVPSVAQLPVPRRAPLRLQLLQLSVLSLACTAVAVYLTWRINGALPI